MVFQVFQSAGGSDLKVSNLHRYADWTVENPEARLTRVAVVKCGKGAQQ